MKKRSIFILIIILLFNVSLVFCATDEGYGEANDNLGQFTDTFENTDNITVMDDVIRNATLECIELNYTIETKVYENYSLYTEVDIGADRIQRTDYHIDHKAYRNEITYCYYDKSINYFTDFTHEFMARSGFDQALSNGIIWMVANDLGDAIGLKNAGKTYLNIEFYRGSTARQILIREAFGSTWYSDVMDNPSINTWYYFTIIKLGTALSCEIYSDSARLNLLDTLSITLQADHSFRYIYGCNTFNVPSVAFMNTDIENLWIGDMLGGYEDNGYFITDDYLNYTTGNSLALLTNASIPDGTEMTVQFSNDNVTWVDNEGNVGSISIEDGFYAIDLRNLNYIDNYKMVNFSGTSTLTPRLYQLREVTTNGTGGVGGTVYIYRYPASTFIMIIFLFSLGLGIIWMVKKK